MAVSTVTIECQADIADEISKNLTSVSNGPVARADKTNLSGGLETTLLVAQTAVPLLAALVPLLVPFLARTKVTRVKIKKPDGTEFEIANPTEAQLKQYLHD